MCLLTHQYFWKVTPHTWTSISPRHAVTSVLSRLIRDILPSGSDLAGAKAPVTLHWMKGRRSTKIGIRVRTIKSRKSHRASPPTFRSAISLTCRLSQYHWLSSWRSKQTRITFKATGKHTTAKGNQRCYRVQYSYWGRKGEGHNEHKPAQACMHSRETAHLHT